MHLLEVREQRSVREHRGLGRAGRTRGEQQDREVARRALDRADGFGRELGLVTRVVDNNRDRTRVPAGRAAREIDAVEPALVLASAANAELARRAGSQSSTAPPVAVIEDASGDGASVDREAAELAVLLFTAGTAGAPKPAMLTHGSLLANLEQMQAHPGLRVGAGDVALAVLPLFHVFGLNVVLGLALMAGGAVTLVDHFHPTETLHRVRTDGVTVIAVVPAVLDAWLALDESAAPPDALARVRLCVSGAAPNFVLQRQNNFVFVCNCTCVSRPIIRSYFNSDIGLQISDVGLQLAD